LSNFKSGCVHDQLTVTDQQTAVATLQGMKESEAWAGLFDVKGEKAYTVPVDPHNWELVPYGMKRTDEHGNKTLVTYLLENIGGKEFKRNLEKCTGCSKCLEIGFKKTRVK